MKNMPESISYGDFRKAFPIQKNKPMINDPECWEALVEAANRTSQQSSLEAPGKFSRNIKI